MQKDGYITENQVKITRAQVKHLIKSKFKSVRRYCDLTDQSTRYSGLRVLLNKHGDYTHAQVRDLERHYNTAMSTNDAVLKDEIKNSDRNWIRDSIRTLYGSLAGFCRAFDEVPRSTVRDLLNGRTRRKNEAFKLVCQFLFEQLDRKGLL